MRHYKELIFRVNLTIILSCDAANDTTNDTNDANDRTKTRIESNKHANKIN